MHFEIEPREGHFAARFGVKGDPMPSHRNEITPVIIGSSGWLSKLWAIYRPLRRSIHDFDRWNRRLC